MPVLNFDDILSPNASSGVLTFDDILPSDSGMPTGRKLAPQVAARVSPQALAPRTDVGGMAGVGESLKAQGRGVLKGFGGLGDIGGSAIGLPTSEDVSQAFGLKETPPQYAMDELFGSMIGPSLVTKPLGAAGRAIGGVAEGVSNWLNPKNLALLQATEGKGPEILNALRAPTTIVPGSTPTAAQAASPVGSTLYSALEQQVSKEMPTAFLAREDAQAAARLAALRTVAQNKEALDAAKGTRQVTAGELYGAAEAGAIKSTRKKYLTWLENAAPEYRVARETFAKQSAPINTMEIGQYLEGKLVPALGEDAAQRASVYSAALRDASGTIQKATTGMPRFDSLMKVLSADDVKTLESIRADLAREARTSKMAREGARAESIVPSTETPTIPNTLNQAVAIANTVMRKLQGKIDKKIAIEIAMEMLDPKLAAMALEKALAYEARNKSIAQAFKAGGASAARVARASAFPAAINALAPSPPNQNALAAQ